MPKPKIKGLRKASNIKSAAIGVETGVIVVFCLLVGFGALSIAPGGCCTVNLTAGVSADFVAEVDGDPSTMYIGGFELFTMSIDPWIYDLILDQGFASETEFIDYMNANYPGTEISYLAITMVDFVDARYIADGEYDNMSTVGLSKSICLPGILYCPYMTFELFYDNGTLYDSITFMLFDEEDVDFESMEYGDYVNMTSSIPSLYVGTCGETFTVIIDGLSLDSGTGDIVITVTVNGHQFDIAAGGGPPT